MVLQSKDFFYNINNNMKEFGEYVPLFPLSNLAISSYVIETLRYINGFGDATKGKLKRILFANKSSGAFYYYHSFLHLRSIFVMV